MGSRVKLKLKHFFAFFIKLYAIDKWNNICRDVKHTNPVTSVTLSQSNCAFVMFVCIVCMYTRDVCMYSSASKVNFCGVFFRIVEKNLKNRQKLDP